VTYLKACEGGIYWFQRSRSALEEDKYEESLKYLRNGYEQIETTNFIRNTEARNHIEASAEYIRSRDEEKARDHLNYLIHNIEDHQKEYLDSLFPWLDP